MLLGREPALLLGLIAAAVKLLGYELDVSDGTQTAINAIAAGMVAIIIAFVAKNGAWAAALLQTAQAVMSLFVGLGLDSSADRQAPWTGTIAAPPRRPGTPSARTARRTRGRAEGRGRLKAVACPSLRHPPTRGEAQATDSI